MRPPETVLIAITVENGPVALMQFVTKQFPTTKSDMVGIDTPGWEREPTKENIEAEIAKAAAGPNGEVRFVPLSWRFATMDEVPKDRTFRNALKDESGKLKHHMPTARNIWRDKMRQARANRLSALDTEYMRADEIGNAQSKKDIAAKKQALRDVTTLPEIEAAKTPEELKAVWPSILEG